MPTYSYRCTQCSTAFDVQQAFTDDSLTECPSCQGGLRKIFSAVGVTFNGSGFYRTDSRAGASGGKSAASGKGDAGRKSDAGGKSDAGATSSSGSSATSEQSSKPSGPTTPAVAASTS